jgi:hypothetical protein
MYRPFILSVVTILLVLHTVRLNRANHALRQDVEAKARAYNGSYAVFRSNVIHYYNLNLTFAIEKQCGRMKPHDRRFLIALNFVFDAIHNKPWTGFNRSKTCTY